MVATVEWGRAQRMALTNKPASPSLRPHPPLRVVAKHVETIFRYPARILLVCRHRATTQVHVLQVRVGSAAFDYMLRCSDLLRIDRLDPWIPSGHGTTCWYDVRAFPDFGRSPKSGKHICNRKKPAG